MAENESEERHAIPRKQNICLCPEKYCKLESKIISVLKIVFLNL